MRQIDILRIVELPVVSFSTFIKKLFPTKPLSTVFKSIDFVIRLPRFESPSPPLLPTLWPGMRLQTSLCLSLVLSHYLCRSSCQD